MIKINRIGEPKVMNFIFGMLIAFGFILIDYVVLSFLPRLNISYGGIRFSLFGFIFLRGMIFLIWLIIVFISTSNHSAIQSGVSGQVDSIRLLPVCILIAINLAIIAFEIDSFIIEPSRISISHLKMEVPGLKQPVRIVQLSDIHVEYESRRERLLPGIIDDLKPDIIVMTGDYLNESYKRNQQSQKDLKNLVNSFHAPLGIYAVNGNVETRINMADILKNFDIHLIDNEIVRIPQPGDDIVLIGVEFDHWVMDENTLIELMREVKPEDYSILLYHKPDLAYQASDLGVDLYLTGHTHGGQFRLPFYGAIVTDARYGKLFEMGRYQLDNMTMYVSRGLGMAGGFAPRIRFLCLPEVVVIDLIPAETLPSQ